MVRRAVELGVEANLATLGIDHRTPVNLRGMNEHEGVNDVSFDDQPAEMVKLWNEGKIAGVEVAAARVGLAMLLARATNVLLMHGISSVAHLEESMAVGDLTFDDDDLRSRRACRSR